MNIKSSILAIATSALTVSGAFAEISAEAKASLKAMSDKLSAAEQLTVSASRTISPELLKLDADFESAQVNASMQRPDKLTCALKAGDTSVTIHLGKDGSSIFNAKNKFYARFPGKPTLNEAFDAAQEEIGLSIPIQDMLCKDPYNDLTAKVKDGKVVGEETLDGEACDHLAFTQDDVDWEVWIGKSDHLPRKFVISIKEVEGKNHLVIDKMQWDLDAKIDAKVFTFTPPEGATEIEFLPMEENEDEVTEDDGPETSGQDM